MNALKTLGTCVSIAAAFAIASPAQAQAWPEKQIRVVVPYPPGGGVDFVSRAVAQRLGEVLKTTLVIDNRGGASGTIGADIVAKSAPDGYTFLIASPAEVVVGPIVGQKVNYDPARDLTPVTLIGETPLVIAAHPSLQAKTLQEFIALAKASPGKYSYGTPGTGSSMQFAGESLNSLAGISVVHVPYRGAVPHAKSGKLRILAVTSEKRSSAMPDVPAVAELPGMKGYRFTNWMGVYVPAKTPQPVIDRLAAEIAKIVREPAMREKLLSQGVEPVGDTTAEFAAFLKAEFDTYSKIAKDRNIRATE
ncbi:MAG: tripartite tricarboxylate transporter substrate binding protein [Betaproteobacteria bacterium]|nr:tripartite tricarboxylate transporter substrate binding protein [Betaproteobacteria bacterium]